MGSLDPSSDLIFSCLGIEPPLPYVGNYYTYSARQADIDIDRYRGYLQLPGIIAVHIKGAPSLQKHNPYGLRYSILFFL